VEATKGGEAMDNFEDQRGHFLDRDVVVFDWDIGSEFAARVNMGVDEALV
jgi:hypothetical protein